MDSILDKDEHLIFGRLVCLYSLIELIFYFLLTGVLLFEMVFGYRPFEHIRDNYDKMSYIARLTQNPIIPITTNPHLYDVLQQCLQIDPSRRLSADQILQHSF